MFGSYKITLLSHSVMVVHNKEIVCERSIKNDCDDVLRTTKEMAERQRFDLT
jgi:hypothetical protein